MINGNNNSLILQHNDRPSISNEEYIPTSNNLNSDFNFKNKYFLDNLHSISNDNNTNYILNTTNLIPKDLDDNRCLRYLLDEILFFLNKYSLSTYEKILELIESKLKLFNLQSNKGNIINNENEYLSNDINNINKIRPKTNDPLVGQGFRKTYPLLTNQEIKNLNENNENDNNEGEDVELITSNQKFKNSSSNTNPSINLTEIKKMNKNIQIKNKKSMFCVDNLKIKVMDLNDSLKLNYSFTKLR